MPQAFLLADGSTVAADLHSRIIVALVMCHERESAVAD